MTITRKLALSGLMIVILLLCGLNAAMASDDAKTYAYLPDHSVYFYDVSDGDAWSFREVDALALADVIRGDGNHLFYPNQAITRADFIVMLDRVYNMSEAVQSGKVVDRGTFSDIPTGAYYAAAVNAAKAWGIAAGSENNRFRPLDSMTRQDAMVFLKRTLDRTGITMQSGSLSQFSDAAAVSDYAVQAVGELVGAAVIGGDSNGLMKPKATVSRAEMAVMLYRATHLTTQDSGTFYENRKDVVNLCVGSKVYSDVVIENYDPARQYSELMRYSRLHTENDGVTYVALEEQQKIDRTAVVSSGTLIISDSAAKDGFSSYPISADCVALDITHYHSINQPVSTGTDYRFCYPSIEGGEVTAIYYIA